MDIAFSIGGDARDWNETARMVRKHGSARAKLIRRRLDDLKAAHCLEVMRILPGRTHELKGDRSGELSVDLDGPYRLIFRPEKQPPPVKVDGGLDWKEVTAIVILEVADTHE
jgi:plasmid maintenance system killer protein